MVSRDDFVGRDVISIEDFSKQEIDYVLDNAAEIKARMGNYSQRLAGRIMVPIFVEDSTRTVMSTQMAMLRLGGSVVDFDVGKSSFSKGETLEHTFKVIDSYNPDVVVMRHDNDGVAQLAADLIKAPFINCGDGKNFHPTQTFLDLFTIREHRGSIDGLKIAIAGDLMYGRPVHSLAEALGLKYEGCNIKFISPEQLKMPKDLLKRLKTKGAFFSEHDLEDLELIINSGDVDFLYMTRVQRERFPKGPEGDQMYEDVTSRYNLKRNIIKTPKPGFKILHPMPIFNEVARDIDDTEYAHYIPQAGNGPPTRMSLLDLIVV
ncbi:MAG: aspartate carbamoyltransferase [Nanoarchaeota archaeon]